MVIGFDKFEKEDFLEKWIVQRFKLEFMNTYIANAIHPVPKQLSLLELVVSLAIRKLAFHHQ